MVEIWTEGRVDEPFEWFGFDTFLWNDQMDATPSVVASEVVHYAVQIDISDNTDIADEKEIGLFNDALLNGGSGGSAFRWITDRPTYDGSTVVPTGEIPTANATKWGEGMLKRSDKLGAPNRLININIAGNYGSLSGFTFSIDNVEIETGNFAGQMFFDVLDDNSMFMLNRKIRFYIVLGDVFFNVWSGIVAKVSHTETEFKVICEDDFKNIHKTLPKQIANEKLFPKIIKKSISKPIPVTLGINNHAKILNVRTISDPIDLFDQGDAKRPVAPMFSYLVDVDGDGNKTASSLSISVGLSLFAKDELVGKFLRVILEGGTDNFFRIKSSGKTNFSTRLNANTVVIAIDGFLEEDDLVFYDTTPQLFGFYTIGTWVEIFDFESVYIVSNDGIKDFPDSDLGYSVKIDFYDKDKEEFLDVSEAGEVFNLTDVKNTGFPGIIAFTDVTGNDGNFFKFITFKPEKLTLLEKIIGGNGAILQSDDFPGIGEEIPNLTDKSRATKNQIVIRRPVGFDINVGEGYGVKLEATFPDSLKDANFQELYIIVDYNITAEKTSDSTSTSKANLQIRPRDLFGRAQIERFPVGFLSGKFTAGVPLLVRLINPEYFNETGEGEILFDTLRGDLNLVSFYTDAGAFKAFPSVEFFITGSSFSPSVPDDLTLDIFEVVFAGLKSIQITEDNIFVKVNGEKVISGGENTDNVFTIFQKILEDYDELTITTEFDLTGISSRLNWIAGRQLTERKSSFTYMKELAMQSFVGIFPSRTGLRTFKAFREFATSSVTFSNENGNIIADSITRFELSPINEVFNEFDIKYEFIEAGRRFDKSVFIKRVVESAFPGRFVSTDSANDIDGGTLTDFTITNIVDDNATGVFTFGATPGSYALGQTISFDDSAGIGIFEFGELVSFNGTTVTVNFKNTAGFILGQSTATGTITIQGSSIPEWTTFAGGFVNYNRGSTLWTVCRNSFLETMVVRELPAVYSDCKWYVDEDAFNGGTVGQGATPFKYLELLVEWATLQKEIVEFGAPITTENVQRELLDFVKFSDQKYTAGELREGYITKIKPSPASDRIIFELSLIPSNIESITDCLIVESGINADTIVESGTEADTIVETGLC